MEELQETRIEATNAEDNNSYIEAINEMKKNSVDKSKYEQLQAENKKLLNSLINGDPYAEKQVETELPTRAEAFKKYKENQFSTDLDYWKNFLDLRDATIKEYGKDPCVTGNYGQDQEGHTVESAYGEAETMEENMNTLKQMIEDSNGDPVQFKNLMRQAIR